MKNLILIAFAASFLFGCKSQQRAAKKYAKLEQEYPDFFKDSTTTQTTTQTTEKDTSITVPGKTFTVTVPSPCPVDYNYTGRVKGGSATLTIRGGVTKITCAADSAILQCKLKDIAITYWKTRAKTVSIPRNIIKPLSAYEQFSRILTLIILIVCATYFGTKYLAPLIKALLKL